MEQNRSKVLTTNIVEGKKAKNLAIHEELYHTNIIFAIFSKFQLFFFLRKFFYVFTEVLLCH
jgi:hypothetical protein